MVKPACSSDRRWHIYVSIIKHAQYPRTWGPSRVLATNGMARPKKPKGAKPAAANGGWLPFIFAGLVAVLAGVFCLNFTSAPQPPKPKIRASNANLFAEAYAFYLNKDMQSAAARFQEYLLLEPSDVNALNNLGLAQTSLGEHAAAIETFKRAIGRRGGHADAYNNLGIVLGSEKRLDESVDAYQSAIRIDPANLNARTNLAAALTSTETWAGSPPLSRFQEAADVLGNALVQVRSLWTYSPARCARALTSALHASGPCLRTDRPSQGAQNATVCAGAGP